MAVLGGLIVLYICRHSKSLDNILLMNNLLEYILIEQFLAYIL